MSGPIRFYEDMFCQPVYLKNDNCCPLKYDCSEVLKYNVSDHCFDNGKISKINETVIDAVVWNGKNCYCRENIGRDATTICRESKCPKPEFPFLVANCYLKYSQRECGNKVVCPKHPANCTINGKVVKEGDVVMIPGNPFRECSCQMKMKNGEKVANPFCVDRITFCKSESFFRKILIEHRAPLYSSQSFDSPQESCPASVKVYKEGDFLVEKDLITEFGNCTFGPLTVPLSWRLNRYNPVQNTFSCATCRCLMPPSLACKKMPLADCEGIFETFKRDNPHIIDKLFDCVLIDKDI